MFPPSSAFIPLLTPLSTAAWKQNQPQAVFDQNPDYDTPEGKKKKVPKDKRLEGFKS